MWRPPDRCGCEVSAQAVVRRLEPTLRPPVDNRLEPVRPKEHQLALTSDELIRATNPGSSSVSRSGSVFGAGELDGQRLELEAALHDHLLTGFQATSDDHRVALGAFDVDVAACEVVG